MRARPTIAGVAAVLALLLAGGGAPCGARVAVEPDGRHATKAGPSCHAPAPDRAPDPASEQRAPCDGGRACPYFCHAVAIAAAAPPPLEPAPRRTRVETGRPPIQETLPLRIDHVPLR